MKILAATPWYVPEGGGLERYAHHVFRRLAARGNDVHVVAFTRDAPGDVELDGVRVTRVRPALVVSNTPLGPRLVTALWPRARDADVIVGHGPVPFAAEAAAVVARAARKPFVFTYHAAALRGGSPGLDVAAILNRWTIERWAFATARQVVTVSPVVADGYLSRYKRKLEVIPPGVDAKAFTPDGRGTHTPTALYVGPVSRAYTWKGFPVLYEAFREVAERVPEARLDVVGAGDLVDAYRARSAREGLADRVRFLGRVDDAALVEAYRRAAVAVLPSTSDAESFGMVLAEANACGTPVVASAVGGVPVFVRDGDNGLLVPPGDARALARAVTRLLESPEDGSALGKRGRERVVAEHDWDVIAARSLDAYEKAMMEAAFT